jgi:hypothetical protein
VSCPLVSSSSNIIIRGHGVVTICPRSRENVPKLFRRPRGFPRFILLGSKVALPNFFKSLCFRLSICTRQKHGGNNSYTTRSRYLFTKRTRTHVLWRAFAYRFCTTPHSARIQFQYDEPYSIISPNHFYLGQGRHHIMQHIYASLSRKS